MNFHGHLYGRRGMPNIFDLLDDMMRKRAAAILTPEAEQAAVQAQQGGGMPPPGMPPQGTPPQGGMPPQGGGQLPPEILQDQGFLEFMAQQGAQFDPNSGMFIDMQSGQPIPPDAVMQAYDMYMQQMQGGGMPPQGMPPQGDMPPQGMDPAMQGGQPMAPADAMVPQEIMQDDMFMQFLTEQFGLQLDPNTGTFMDPQTGQPVPPNLLTQAYQVFQQQMQNVPPEAMQPGQGGMPGQEMSSDMLGQLQKMVDESVRQYTAEVGKKMETMIDKLDTVKQMLESIQGTDDARAKADVEEDRDVQDQLNAELSDVQSKSAAAPRPVNMFDILSRK